MKEKPTHWTLGWSLDVELGFNDGTYLPRRVALILYPEYFNENGEPILNVLPVGKPKSATKNIVTRKKRMK